MESFGCSDPKLLLFAEKSQNEMGRRSEKRQTAQQNSFNCAVCTVVVWKVADCHYILHRSRPRAVGT